MTTHLRNAATAAAITFTFAGCGNGTSGPFDPPSTLVIRWSQADHRELTQNTAAHPSLRTHLVGTAQERDEVLADLPSSIPERDRALVESMDLEAQVIVLGVYGKCTERSHLTLDDTVLHFVVERDEGTDCAWAPTQVEVWGVDRADLPTPVRLVDQRGEPA